MESRSDQTGHIPGWGVDADNTNEPTHPIKRYTGDDHRRTQWQRPVQQKQTVEILKSNERPTLSAVFGTTYPPRGISGWMRRRAFRFSENQYRHWLPMLLADRVNVIEGVLGDLFHGRLPNYWRERGLTALWKYKRGAFLAKLLFRLVIVAAIAALIVYLERN